MRVGAFLVFACCFAGAAFAQDKGDSKVDLSGLPGLKAVFAAQGKSHGLTVVRRFSRGEDEAGWELDSDSDILREGDKLRVDNYGFFGDGTRYICDGKTAMTDDLDTRVTLENAPKGFAERTSGTSVTDNGGVITQAFAGVDGLEKVVDVSKPVTMSSVLGGIVYSFTHKWDGSTVRLMATKDQIHWVEYATQRNGFRGGAPSTQYTRDEIIEIQSKPKVDKNAFSTKPFPGTTVIDRRKDGDSRAQVFSGLGAGL